MSSVVINVENKEEIIKLSPDKLINAQLEANLQGLKAEYEKAGPFPHISIPDFLNEDYARLLKDELLHEEFYTKSNDLYDFAQTKDLQNQQGNDLPMISHFNGILSHIRKSMEGITGIKLEKKADVFGAIYSNTGKLLCHDDHLPGRRIAYILYLTPDDWSSQDGGSLDLFQVDGKGEPCRVVKSVVPTWNSFLFFEVSKHSFHQVAEVLSKKARVSISGWFYGDPIDHKIVEDPVPEYLASTNGSYSLDEWVGRTYRKPNMIKQINKTFMDESSIELRGFLRKNKYDALCHALYVSKELKHVGPFHKRNYSRIDPQDEKKEENIVSEFRGFLLSKEFSEFVSKLTGVKTIGGSFEYRKFDKGCYTLAHDADHFMKTEGLDVVMCLLPSRTKWTLAHGGSVHYIDGEDELLTIPACENTLSLVYRAEGGTSKFVKYINHRAPCPRIDASCTYTVEEDDEEDS